MAEGARAGGGRLAAGAERSMEILWIMIPGPFVGYLVMDSVRKIFSDDDEALTRVFKAQPVTMVAAATALGSVVVWAVAEAVLRIL